jgi:copper chaperone CopZ/branched-subunit amino acid transport protein
VNEFSKLQVGNELHHQQSLEDSACCDEHQPLTHVVMRHGRVNEWTLKKRRTSKSMKCGEGCQKSCCVSSAVELSVMKEISESLQITKIYAEGVCCPFEIPVVENSLLKMPGVDKVEVAVITKTVVVQHFPSQTSPAALVAALNEARLGATLTFPRKQIKSTSSWIPPWHICLATVLLILSLLHYLSGPTGVEWLEYFKYVALGSIALLLPNILLNAFGALRNWVLDIHFLMSVAVAGALALQDYSEAATVVVLFSIADFLESRCTGQA